MSLLEVKDELREDYSELEKSRGKCEEMEVTITRLMEEQIVSSDRENRVKERFDKLLENNSKMKSQKDTIICELNEKVGELENTISELRVRISESDKAAGVKNEKMFDNSIILELNEKINELKSKNSEKERLVVEVYQEKFQCVDENEKLKFELAELKRQLAEKEELLGRYNAFFEDQKKLIKNVSQSIGQTRQQQVHDHTFPDIEGVYDENIPAAEDNNAVYKTVDELRPKKLEQNRSKGLHDSGYSSKKPPSSIPSGDIIELCSDDKTNPGGATSTSDECATVGENEMAMVKVSSTQTNKRNRTEDSPIELTQKTKRCACESDNDNLPINEIVVPEPSSSSSSPSIYQSLITSDHVEKLRKSMGIPHEYEIVIPSPEDRHDRPPPGFLCFLADQLEGGLRFPIPPLFSEISRLFNISLCQLTPNSFRQMTAFAMVTKPTAHLFKCFFHAQYDKGYFNFDLKTSDQSSIQINNREFYFFISSPHPWNFPTVWRESLTEVKNNLDVDRDPAVKSLFVLDEECVGDDDNKKRSCKVPGCNADITGKKKYYHLSNICGFHAKADVVLIAGVEKRFCQNCNRFDELAEFDEAKRACRTSCDKKNRDRRRRTIEKRCMGKEHI